MNDKQVWLESGTNELEIVEFRIGDAFYCINVLKVKEILMPAGYTELPQSHPNILGITDIRGKVVPVIDLSMALGKVRTTTEMERWILCEMNQQQVAFQVDEVYYIHRISWEDIEKPSEIFQTENSVVNGVISMNEKVFLLIDFEKILTDINPMSGIHEKRLSGVKSNKERESKRILLAEDSEFLIKLISGTISKAGYHLINTKQNGLEMWEYIESLVNAKGEGILDSYHCLITDIEMPKMDGLHLIKKVREHPILRKLPIIIFSSLITDDLRHKGDMVGADAQISKPEIGELIATMDKLIFPAK